MGETFHMLELLRFFGADHRLWGRLSLAYQSNEYGVME